MILNSIKNYLDFNVVNPSVKYLSLVAFFTGIILSYFYTVLVIIQKYAGYSEFTIGVVASFVMPMIKGRSRYGGLGYNLEF